MTEQPKFQRRKRRGTMPLEAKGKSAAPERQDRKATDLDALLAEKEALLRRKAELEAKRQQQARIEAERQREAEASAASTREDHTTPTAGDPAPKQRPPLVLASAPVLRPEAAPAQDPEHFWRLLDRFPLDAQRLATRNVITAQRRDPSHTRFDILRTRMLQALADNGWKRVAITSPTKDCGKTFTAANLAISLSRQENCRTILLDLDMRNPSLHKIFGVSDPGSMGDMLRGDIAPEHHMQGFAPNAMSAGSHVAIGFNGIVEPYAAELLQDPSTKSVLNEIEAIFDPDVMLFDLPPALLNDDVIAMRPHVDALLIVAAGGTTRASEIKETERRLGESIPLLGVVLNKAEQVDNGDYPY